MYMYLSFCRYALATNDINHSLSTPFDDTQESALSFTASTELPPETMPRFPTTAHTAQVSIDGHYSSISEPSTGTVKAEGSVEEASSAIANACMLHECMRSVFKMYIYK